MRDVVEMNYHDQFAELAKSYPMDSLWVLPPGNRRYRWVDFCIDAMREGLEGGNDLDVDPEAYWRAAHAALELAAEILVSAEPCLR